MQNETETTTAPGVPVEEFRINPILTLDEMRVRYVQWVVKRFSGNKKAAADALGVKRQTVHRLLKKAEERPTI